MYTRVRDEGKTYREITVINIKILFTVTLTVKCSFLQFYVMLYKL